MALTVSVESGVVSVSGEDLLINENHEIDLVGPYQEYTRMCEDVEEGQLASASLIALAQKINPEEGLSPVAMEMLFQSVHQIRDHLGMPTTQITMETYGGLSGRNRRARLSLELLKETIKTIARKIFEFVRNIVRWVKRFFRGILGDFKRYQNRTSQILEEMQKSKDLSETTDKKFKDQSVIKRIAAPKTANDPTERSVLTLMRNLAGYQDDLFNDIDKIIMPQLRTFSNEVERADFGSGDQPVTYSMRAIEYTNFVEMPLNGYPPPTGYMTEVYHKIFPGSLVGIAQRVKASSNAAEFGKDAIIVDRQQKFIMVSQVNGVEEKLNEIDFLTKADLAMYVTLLKQISKKVVDNFKVLDKLSDEFEELEDKYGDKKDSDKTKSKVLSADERETEKLRREASADAKKAHGLEVDKAKDAYLAQSYDKRQAAADFEVNQKVILDFYYEYNTPELVAQYNTQKLAAKIMLFNNYYNNRVIQSLRSFNLACYFGLKFVDENLDALESKKD